MPIKVIKTLTIKISLRLNIPKEVRNKLISQIPMISMFTAVRPRDNKYGFCQVFLPTVFTSLKLKQHKQRIQSARISQVT